MSILRQKLIFICYILFFSFLSVAWSEGEMSGKKLYCSIKDEKTGISYCVDMDRKRVFAVDGKNVVLWNVEPYKKITHTYANHIPYINFFNSPKADWLSSYRMNLKVIDVISINFDGGYFGVIKKENGEFIFLGKD
jgi:hypothetical protein